MQRKAFAYFLHETHPGNGLVLDKTAPDWPASIAATGLALACYPVAVERGLMAEIIGRFERRGLHFRGMRLLQLDRATAEHHYAEHRERPFFGELVDFITSGPIVALALQGEQAIELVRGMMGATDPKKSPPGTIRGDLAIALGENVVHGSDSPESAERELGLFFADGLLP